MIGQASSNEIESNLPHGCCHLFCESVKGVSGTVSFAGLNVEAYAEFAYDLTPYRYSFNNPVQFKDPDGHFDFDTQTEKNNPELVKYLKGLVNIWNNSSSEYKKAFLETSGLTEVQTIEMLTYGRGPSLQVENLDKDTDGDGVEDDLTNGATFGHTTLPAGKDRNVNHGKGLIKLDDDIVGAFTNATNRLDKDSGENLVESTLFHKGVNFGRNKLGISTTINDRNGNQLETGNEFERHAYGRDIGRGNAKTYTQEQQKISTIKPASFAPLPAPVITATALPK